MRLDGWNHIPRGYAADFDVGSAPWWLRLWFHTPFVDRFAYPQLVGRGFGHLRRQPECADEDRGPIDGGWRVRDPEYRPPGSFAILRQVDKPDR